MSEVTKPLQRVQGHAICIYPGTPEDGCPYKGCGLTLTETQKAGFAPAYTRAYGCALGHRSHFRVTE